MKTKIGATLALSLLIAAGCENNIQLNKNATNEEMMLEQKQEKKEWKAIDTKIQANTDKLTYEIINEQEIFTKPFPEVYQDVEGILTFRSGPLRNNASIGSAKISKETLEKKWTFQTSSSPEWGGGAGWVGQASVIKWKKQEMKIMNLYPEFKNKENFKEVVYASLDGRIYFLDFETGKQTREPINIKNPIKGSVALDPRGYPLLYVGQGIPQTGQIGYRIFNLIDGSLLEFIPGIDPYAYRGWGAFDGAALINKDEDAMVIAGENGIMYSIKLNTTYLPEQSKISIDPVVSKYRYQQKNNAYQGMENSIAVYKNIAYFADNGGGVQAFDLIKRKPIWVNEPYDDTDATIAVEEIDGEPYIYVGSEIDKQGSKGISRIQKLNGLDGTVIWEKEIPGFSLVGDDPVNGGMLATPIVGEGPLEGQIIFNISRYKTFNGGLLISYDRNTGEENWRWEMPNYSWSSPVAVYSKDNKAYIIQGDSVGNMNLLNDKGELLEQINLGANIEASPIVVDNEIIVASRGGQIFNISIK